MEKRHLVVLAGLLFLAILTSWLRFRHVPRASGPMPHQVYVWQRDWPLAVRDAVAAIDPQLSPPVLLAAEVSWEGTTPRVIRVPIDPAGKPFGVALRINSIDPGKIDAPVVVDIAKSIVAASPTELHIDFDCAESKLDAYRRWVVAIKHAVRPVPVVITALPAWLDQSSFRSLAAESPYILQLHSLRKPKRIDDNAAIIDPATAEAHVERAARMGVPFRVALPTYGYVAVFEPDGTLQRLWAENFPGAQAGQQVRYLRTSPTDMARLVRAWTESRPAAMTGIIWYRLPVAGEQLNWRPQTLATVTAGQTPQAKLQFVTSTTQPIDLTLLNTGNADAPLPAKLTITWTGDAPIASDFLAGYRKLDEQPGRITLSFHGPADSSPPALLPAGDRRAIGWLRFAKDTEVRGHVDSP